MRPYIVSRPYCYPPYAVVMASGRKDAKERAQRAFGYVHGTSVRLLKHNEAVGVSGYMVTLKKH